jgi:hypothetical protein
MQGIIAVFFEPVLVDYINAVLRTNRMLFDHACGELKYNISR